MSEGAYWELYNPLRYQEIAKVKQMASLMMVEMLGKLWLEQLMRGQCLSPRTDLQNMEETRAGLSCRWGLRPVCVSLLLRACPFNLEHGGSPLDSLQPSLCFQTGAAWTTPSVLPYHQGRTCPFCQNIIPNTFFCASWPLKEQNPWERNPERNSSFEKYRTKLL